MCPTDIKPGTMISGNVKQVNAVCGNSSTPAVSVPAEIMKVRAVRGLKSVVDCRFMFSESTPSVTDDGINSGKR